MAPSSSLFDHLPDDIVTFILGFLGNSSRARLQRRPCVTVDCAKDLFRAQLVCRRFERLSHAIRVLDWPLRNEKEGVGLINFVNHKHFSVETLNLLITDKIEKLQHHLIFSSSLLQCLPETVNIYCMGSGERAFGGGSSSYKTPDPETGRNIVENILSGSAIRQFSIEGSEAGSYWISLVIIKMLKETPELSLRHVDLSRTAAIGVTALNNLVRRCIYIESLKVNELYRPEVFSECCGSKIEDKATEVFVKSGTLKVLELKSIHYLSLEVQAPILHHLNIGPEFDSIILKTPLLQDFALCVTALEGPVRFVEPCNKLEHLRFRDCSSKVWEDRIVPILVQCPSVGTLTLQGWDFPVDSSLPVSRFLSQLPSNVRTLCLDEFFLSGLGVSKLKENQLVPILRSMQVELSDRLDSYFKLRLLAKAMPNLQKLQAAVDSEKGERGSAGIVALFRTDFKDLAELNVRVRLVNRLY